MKIKKKLMKNYLRFHKEIKIYLWKKSDIIMIN